MHSGRHSVGKRSAFELRIDPLFVHGMAGFVDGPHQRLSEHVLIDAGGDADVPQGKPGHERMGALVLTAPGEVKAKPLNDFTTERQLSLLREGPAEAAVVERGMLVDGLHERRQTLAQLVEDYSQLSQD